MKTPPAKQAYALLRFVMGIDMFLHGATRIGSGVDKFAATMVREFQSTVLPPDFVHFFGTMLPYIEGLVGVLLLLGLFTRQTLIVCSLLMAALVFGTALRSDWNTIGLQLIYAAIYYLLLSKIDDNAFAVDSLRRRTVEPFP